MKRRTLAVAVTGGIASGKSEVVSVFARQGALVVSADDLARKLLESDPSVRRKIIRLLGERAYPPPARGGKPDRAFIADRIFTRPALRRALNAIVHPAVITSVDRIILNEKRKGRRRLVVVEAALIYEAGMEKMFDAIIVVDAPVEVRVARIRRRDGLTRREALARIRSQGSGRKKVSLADIVISNTGDRRALRRTSGFLCRLLTGIAEAGS